MKLQLVRTQSHEYYVLCKTKVYTLVSTLLIIIIDLIYRTYKDHSNFEFRAMCMQV